MNRTLLWATCFAAAIPTIAYGQEKSTKSPGIDFSNLKLAEPCQEPAPGPKEKKPEVNSKPFGVDAAFDAFSRMDFPEMAVVGIFWGGIAALVIKVLDAVARRNRYPTEARLVSAAAMAIIGMSLCPPWACTAAPQHGFLGYHWFFAAPQANCIVPNLDIPRLLVQWALVGVLLGMSYWIIRIRIKT